jgi:uncharacterized membrane protein
MPDTPEKPAATTEFLERLEQDPTLGRLAAALTATVGSALGSGPLSDALRGRQLGHALHPVLVQVPLGALLSACVLDVAQGSRAGRQSRLLMGLTCLAVVPAAVTGWAEWANADDRTKRVGVAHAALNLTGAVTSVASYLVRRRGWSPAAAVLTGLAGAAFGCAGVLGGHLSLVRKYASHDRPSDMEGALRGQFTD